jgi:hypothetical protein
MTMKTIWTAFWSDAWNGWLGMPVPMRWCCRVVVLGAIALLLAHLITGSL